MLGAKVSFILLCENQLLYTYIFMIQEIKLQLWLVIAYDSEAVVLISDEGFVLLNNLVLCETF